MFDDIDIGVRQLVRFFPNEYAAEANKVIRFAALRMEASNSLCARARYEWLSSRLPSFQYANDIADFP
jgi:hypothetical protein